MSELAFYVRWITLGLFMAFWTFASILVFEDDVLLYVGGTTVTALITARVFVGPGTPRGKNYPSTVRARSSR